jgi:hypothetical protein
LFRALAEAIATEAGVRALRAERVLEEISFARARDLHRIAREAGGLAEAFAAWEFGDPGPDLRGGALTRLFALREEAAALGVDTTGML